jgi:transcriptional regulator with XRE-family HTH domain
MAIFTEMKDRLLEFLKSENKSSAQLAEEIGVQPSGISHILSGRNNPSLDFVLKMLEKYQFLSTDWLLFGKGTMYKESQIHSLFNEINIIERKPDSGTVTNEPEKKEIERNLIEKDLVNLKLADVEKKVKSSISRIVMFYGDSSFEEYFPRS